MSIEMDEELTSRKGIWEQVPHFFGQSPVCTACGQAPRDDSENLLPGYNAVGVDVDWGNHLFLCSTCVEILSELHGCMSRNASSKLRRQLKLVSEKLEIAETKLADQQAKIDKILEGSKAKKELKNG